MSRIRIMKISQAALLLPVLAGCGTAEGGDAPSVQSVAAVRGDIIATAEATGTLEPVRRVEVTSKASGEILRLHVDVGDVVEPGALLAEVDPRDVRNAYEQERIVFPWQSGDVLLLDNMLTAHGREPYSGSREVLAAMAVPTTRS